MSKTIKLVMVVKMLLAVALLSCEVWDPALGTGNWQSSHYRLYVNGTEETTTPSPFFADGVSHLNDINQGANADFKPEDGWRLYGVEFGDPGVTMQGFPVFGLYNEHLGLLRLFMFRPDGATAYSYIALKAFYNGNSALFGLGEQYSDRGVKALDKRSQLNDNCSFLRVFEDQTASPCWYYIDLNLLYDPVQRIGNPSIYLRMYGATESSINSGLVLSGSISSPNNSSNQSLLSMGKKLISTFKDGRKTGEQISNMLSAMSDPSNETWKKLNLPDQIESAIQSLAGFLENGNVGSLVPWISTASSLFSMMSGRHTDKVLNTEIGLKGSISGTMTAQHSLVTTDFFESISGAKSLTPVYNKTMGLLQMNTTPIINHAKIMYGGGIVGAHTYQFESDPPALLLNPEAGLSLRDSELEAAIEFTILFPSVYTDYMNDTINYTFLQMQEFGCYTLIREDSWITGLDGYSYATYRTPFIPMSQIHHAAFTVPKEVFDARIVVKAIMDLDSSFGDDPVYQLISFDTNINHVGNQSSIYPHIPAQLISVLWEDLTLPNASQPNTNINLSKSYLIETGQTLRFQNCTVNMNDSDFGIMLKNGRLEFSNCIVNCSEGFIEASGSNSIISISDGSVVRFTTGESCLTLSNNAQFIIDCSSTIIQNGTTINLTNGSILLAKNSTVKLNGANITLSNASSVSITENSQFIVSGNSEISGDTPCTYYDPAGAGNGSMYGAEFVVPGDRIIVDNSMIQVAETAIICGTSRWEGICITNIANNDDVSCIMGQISNVSRLSINNSFIDLTSLEISNCGQLQIVEDSNVVMHGVSYRNNDYGIYVDESCVYIFSSQINHNGSTGLSISYPSQNYGFIRGTEIAFNQGNGIELRNSLFNLAPYTNANSIHDNSNHGYLNLSNVPSFVYSTGIANNGLAEVIAMYDGFPVFCNAGDTPQSYVIDNEYDPATFDRYLLVALACPPQNASLDIQSLSIDVSDLTRFFPNHSVFAFPLQPISDSEIMYSDALQCIYVSDYQTAYTTMKTIVSDYPATQAANKALPFLPYLHKAIGGYSDSLEDYLNSINESALQEVKMEALGILKLSNNQFNDAISVFEQIIKDPPNDEKRLIAELNEAYCYYKMVTEGSKELPVESHRTPKSFAEYIKIRDEIMRKITNAPNHIHAVHIAPSVLLESNYPNPFNPSTTITFSIPLSCKVDLSVYNIKGQRVVSLANDCFNEGKHKIVWDGKDQAGNKVASGIYFSRLSANGKVFTNKMVLMK